MANRKGNYTGLLPVLAHEGKGKTKWYRSVSKVVGNYGIKTALKLKNLIETGRVGPDGHTTFDYALEGYLYDGMTEKDVKKYVHENFTVGN